MCCDVCVASVRRCLKKNIGIFLTVFFFELSSVPLSLSQAQVYLGSLFSQEPVRDGLKSVHYLRMAAESGVSDFHCT